MANAVTPCHAKAADRVRARRDAGGAVGWDSILDMDLHRLTLSIGVNGNMSEWQEICLVLKAILRGRKIQVCKNIVEKHMYKRTLSVCC